MDLESIRKRDLRTAVFSYLDECDAYEFIKDLKDIFDEEISSRQAEADLCKEVKDFLFTSTIFGGSNEAEVSSSS